MVRRVLDRYVTLAQRVDACVLATPRRLQALRPLRREQRG